MAVLICEVLKYFTRKQFQMVILLIVMLSGAEISKMSFEQIIVSCDIMTWSDSCFVLIKYSGGILAAEIAK